jgi:Fe-Mn family superoxide dismutase
MSKSKLSDEIKEAINDSLGDLLHEAYVTEPKKFDLRTERLSEKVKNNMTDTFDAYVDALNKTSAALDGADRENANNMISDFRSLKLDEVHNMNASFLMALFFENISDLDSRITMDTLAFLRLERDFGTFDSWQQDFMACCLSSRGGYAVTAYSTFLKRYINFVIDEQSNNVGIGAHPVIVLDVSAKSYTKDYGNNLKAYVTAMMKELNWDKIEQRFKRAERIAKAVTG